VTLPNPTDAELDILKCFWRGGDLSAREVHNQIAADLAWSSSTTRTVLERMRVKGLLYRRDVHGMAVYSATQPKVAVIRNVVRRLRAILEIDGPLPAAAFSGSQILNADDIVALERALNADTPEGDA